MSSDDLGHTDSTTGTDGGTDGSDDPVIEFFWRPGCGFCSMLELDLDRADIAVVKRNIWEDPEAAAVVRSVANGNETVPTIRIGDRSLVNPELGAVVDVVRQVAPQLLPSE